MLAYVATRRSVRQRHPALLIAIVGAHGAALLAVISAKMDLPVHWTPVPTEVRLIPNPPDPPQPQPRHPTVPQPLPRPIPFAPIDRSIDKVILPTDQGPITVAGPSGSDIGPISPLPLPIPQPPVARPVRVAAVLTTSGDALKPPYPDEKRQLAQEATLRLRLRIDERGRVVAVDPIGAADPAFLDSARRHILRSWHYRAATEDGKPVPATVVISLRFELDDA